MYKDDVKHLFKTLTYMGHSRILPIFSQQVMKVTLQAFVPITVKSNESECKQLVTVFSNQQSISHPESTFKLVQGIPVMGPFTTLRVGKIGSHGDL